MERWSAQLIIDGGGRNRIFRKNHRAAGGQTAKGAPLAGEIFKAHQGIMPFLKTDRAHIQIPPNHGGKIGGVVTNDPGFSGGAGAEHIKQGRIAGVLAQRLIRRIGIALQRRKADHIYRAALPGFVAE